MTVSDFSDFQYPFLLPCCQLTPFLPTWRRTHELSGGNHRKLLSPRGLPRPCSLSFNFTFLLCLWMDSLLISQAKPLWDPTSNCLFVIFSLGIAPHPASHPPASHHRVYPSLHWHSIGLQISEQHFPLTPLPPLVTRLNRQCSYLLFLSAHSLLNPWQSGFMSTNCTCWGHN